MPRRLLTPLLAALALLLAAAPAALAAAPAAPASPTARIAVDDCAEDELLVEEEDGTLVCEPDDLSEEDLGDDADALCEDDWSDDEDGEDWGEEELGDEEAFAAVSDDDCAVEDDAAPLLTNLQAKASGRARTAQVAVTFALDAPGTVKLTLARSVAGTAAAGGKRCVVSAGKSGKAAKKGKRCTRTSTVGGPVSVAGVEGANTVAPRRWKGRKLRPGNYVVTATSGGAAKTAAFKIAAG
jgi:hypothetical protein